ncbi:MAG: T9SS type A sorting domain-containing protein [Mucilaginibacter polytrichastri]|nr:T9SS type A sorting domain-containing protein [Mucilaginibacter polytrichastri]
MRAFWYTVLTFLIFTLGTVTQSNAQLIEKQTTYGGQNIGYYVHLPDDYDANKYVYPTIIFFHGIGEMGNGTTDLYKVANNGLPNLIKNNKFPKSFTVNGKTYKFIVICPQLNGAIPWQNWMDMEAQFIKHCKANYRIDNSRFYITGLSQGGGIAWQFCGTSKQNSDNFAALAPVCGAMDADWGYPENIASSKLPVWAFHGADDKTVPLSKSQAWITKINKAAGYDLSKLTVYPNTTHNAWGKAYDLNFNQSNGYSNENIYTWMLGRQRGTSPANAYADQKGDVVATKPSVPETTAPADADYTPAELKKTANDAIRPYNGDYMYGVNMGYYGSAWDDLKLATIAKNAGSNTIRPILPENFLRKWGYTIRLGTFKEYAEKLKMKELTAFVGEASEEVRDKTKYNGCAIESRSFANLYEPIWKSDGSVNEKNYYAEYIQKTVSIYGPYVKFWEVWNEPDHTSADPAAWFNRDPLPCELNNLRAPIQQYIRMLRITYEIVKKYYPDSHVTTGGLGYTSFLDAILRNTDNPDGGKVSSKYPNKGGAYFDILSYHCYPYYYLRSWNNSISNFDFRRHSDAAANQLVIEKNNYEAILKKYGYGTIYPAKEYIVTETNISRKTFEWYNTSETMQRNFIMKVVVQAQKSGIRQMYFYTLGDDTDFDDARTEYDLMGFYNNLTKATPATAKITQSGISHRTVSQLLYQARYNASLTAQLKLPATADGGVFERGGEKFYILWAKTKADKSETASVTFTFPASMNVKTIKQYNWNYSQTKASSDIAGNKITLSSTPVILSVSTQDVIVNNPEPPKDTVKTPVVTPPVTVPKDTVKTPVVTIPTTPVVTVPKDTVKTPVVVVPPVVIPKDTVKTPVVTTPPVIVPPVVTPPKDTVKTPVVIVPPVIIPPADTTETPVVTNPPVVINPPVDPPKDTVKTPVVTTPPVVVKPEPQPEQPEEPEESAGIYPNPVNTEANLSVTHQEKGTGTVSVYNMKGLKIKEVNFSKLTETSTISVPASDLRTGMYIVVIKVNTKVTVLKMMKI